MHLSARELCRLQTFPDDVNITGGRGAVQRQLGNAVPSLLGEVLARAIRTQLLGTRPPAGPPVLLPPDRSPTPAAEPLKSVPRKFYKLRGEHAAHPGTGKGYRATSWSDPPSAVG
jgi:DNA (cytosine-5)-methyltransferase 1